MWKRDLRLHGLANLVNNATLQKYRDAVAEHPYAGLPADEEAAGAEREAYDH